MRYVLGTDEAGYGPNLGPLVVAGCAWQTPDEMPPDTLYEALSPAICRCPSDDGDARLVIADSKQLYQSGGSLAALERCVLGMLAQLGRGLSTWRNCWPAIDSLHAPSWYKFPWHAGYDERLPIDVPAGDLAALAPVLQSGCGNRQVELVELQAAVLTPRRFNDLVVECGNKAELLSLTTLRLARRLIDGLPPGPVHVACDRHGGRARYAALLQHVFDSELVVVKQETAELGVYELRYADRSIEFRFLVKGERMLPTALASMTAKYLRELAMRPFNAFWRQHVPGLRPTAGYPGDARRFWADTAAARARLGVEDCELWRTR